MDYDARFAEALDGLRVEGRYRVFLDILRLLVAFPHALLRAPGGTARRSGATDPADLSDAGGECRRMGRGEGGRVRGQVPGFQDSYVTDIALTLGITESRRLSGRYVLRREDLDQPFDDVIAVTGHWTKYDCTYQIPYRSLLPRRVSNLLAAGRCISVDHRAHHATKEIPACFATGEAAGIAATLSLGAQTPLAELDASQLQQALRAAGAWLG